MSSSQSVAASQSQSQSQPQNHAPEVQKLDAALVKHTEDILSSLEMATSHIKDVKKMFEAPVAHCDFALRIRLSQASTLMKDVHKADHDLNLAKVMQALARSCADGVMAGVSGSMGPAVLAATASDCW